MQGGPKFQKMWRRRERGRKKHHPSRRGGTVKESERTEGERLGKGGTEGGRDVERKGGREE